MTDEQIEDFGRRMTLPLSDDECVALAREIIAAALLSASKPAVLRDDFAKRNAFEQKVWERDWPRREKPPLYRNHENGIPTTYRDPAVEAEWQALATAPAAPAQSVTWRDAIKSYPSPDMTLAPQPSPTAVVLDDERAAVWIAKSDLNRTQLDKTFHASVIGVKEGRFNTPLYARAASPQATATQPVETIESGEPVAWRWEVEVLGVKTWQYASHWSTGPKDARPLYAAPQSSQPVEAGESFVKAVKSLAFLCRTETTRLDSETLAALDAVENHLVAMRTSSRDADGELVNVTTPSAVVLDDERAARDLLAALIDVYDDGQNKSPEDRCYAEGAWKEMLDEVRAYLTASPQPVEQPAQSRGDVLQKAAVLCDQLAGEFPGGAADLCAKTLRRFNEQLDKQETWQ